jgi:hypothetical protein
VANPVVLVHGSSSLADDTGVKFFYPFTTTLVELRMNREPLPVTGANALCFFPGDSG